MPSVRHVIYLHGFASSPKSSKAERFSRELAPHGVGFSCPDFNLPAFETMTVTRMLGQMREAIAAAGAGPIALIGSSLGGFVALHAAARNPAVDRLILLAPALDFGGDRLRMLGDQGIDEWRRRGTLEIFHYGYGKRMHINYETHEDASQYDALTLPVPWPTLVFQGTQDLQVSPEMVKRWAAGQPRVDLRLVKDEHQLGASMDEIWQVSRGFLELR